MKTQKNWLSSLKQWNFIFTFVNFTGLYLIIKFQYDKEKKRFIDRVGKLDPQRENFAKSQKINREILSNVSKI